MRECAFVYVYLYLRVSLYFCLCACVCVLIFLTALCLGMYEYVCVFGRGCVFAHARVLIMKALA